MYENIMNNHQDDGLFDMDYIALLQIASVALEIYSIQKSDNKEKQDAYILRLLERIEDRLERTDERIRRIDKILEGGIYNGR